MLLTLDTETTGLNTEKFEVGCIYTQSGKEATFYNKDEMFKAIIELIETEIKRGHRTYIYAHNHQYDWYTYARGHWDYEGLKYLTLNPFIISYTTKEEEERCEERIKAYLEKQEKKLGTNFNYNKELNKARKVFKPCDGVFLDSYIIFKMSLKDIGNITGDKKMEIDRRLLDKPDLSPEELRLKAEYCMQDCKTLMTGLLTLREKLAETGYKPKKMISAGQIAMSTFMTYLKNEKMWKLFADSSNRRLQGTKYDKLVRTAFRGARCQAFQKGKFKDVTYLDVNSLYPYIMATMRFPNLQTETLDNDLDLNKIGLIKCTIKVPECKIGILPIRYQKGLYFPNKRMKLTSIWTTNEISTALQHGYEIENVKYQISYGDGLNPFSKYIFKLYELKKNSNAETRMAVKLILNSLFGKFAQKPSKKEIKFIERREVPEYHGWKINGTLGNKYLITREIEGKRKYFVHPMISTLITANARLHLLNYIGIIDKEDLLYCDTDSIIMRNFEKYKDRFNISNQLGAWKIVNDKTEIDIKGRKQYMIGNQVKMSGIHKENATMEAFNKGIMTRNRINTFLSTNDMTQAGKFVTEEIEIGKEKDGIPDDVREIEDL